MNQVLVMDTDGFFKKVDLDKCQNLYIKIREGVWEQYASLEEVYITPKKQVILHTIFSPLFSPRLHDGYYVAEDVEIVHIVSMTNSRELLNLFQEL